MQSYQCFVKSLKKKPESMKRIVDGKRIDMNSYYHNLPAQVFDFLWKPCIQAEGFYSAIPKISNNIRSIISESLCQAKAQEKYVLILQKICPIMLTYKSSNNPPEEILKRMEALKKGDLKVKNDICCPLIELYENNKDTENTKPANFEEDLVSHILQLFDTSQKKLNYQHYFLQILNRSVGPSVFFIMSDQMNLEEAYNNILTKNKDKLIYLFNKLRQRQITYGSILTTITAQQNNTNKTQKVKNICIFFLFLEYWDKLRESQQKGKSSMMMELVSQAMHRMLFLAYDDNYIYIKMFLSFLKNCQFTLHQEMKSSVGYHLLALYKIQKYQDNTKICKLIEQLWKERLKGIKINEDYLENKVSFVTNSQKTQQRTLQMLQTKSIKSHSSDRSSSKISRVAILKIFNKKVKTIEDELKRFHIQKVFLLLESFKNYLIFDYQITNKTKCSSVVIELIVTITKRIEQKIKYRYQSKTLNKMIYFELKDLMESYIADYQIKKGSFQSVKLYELYPLDDNCINFQYLLRFHELYNYEQTLKTLFHIKILKNQLNRGLLNTNLQEIQRDLSLKRFERKVFDIFKIQLKEKKIDNKKLWLVGKLLTLESRSILNNLIVNYVFYLFKHEKFKDASYNAKIDHLSELMKEGIESKDDEKIQLFLVMGQILNQVQDKFVDNNLTKICGTEASNNYFSFLKREKHVPYYFFYSDYYKKMNYLKESLFFLELHQFTKQDQPPTQEIVSKAISLYERLDISFKNNIKYIQNSLNIQNNKDKWHQNYQEYKSKGIDLLLIKIQSYIQQIEESSNNNNSLNIDGNAELWINLHSKFIYNFIKDISVLQENQEIYQTLLVMSLIVKFITLRLHLMKDSKYAFDMECFRILLKQIQTLKDKEYQITFIMHFLQALSTSDFSHKLKIIYLDKLLECKKLPQLYKYLRSDLSQYQPNSKVSNHQLVYIVKYYHQRNDFLQCLCMIKTLQERQLAKYNKAQIFQLELDCKFKSMLNFTISDYLLFLKDKCINSISLEAEANQSREQILEKHFSHYFKMFRMLFNRYNFASQTHNDVFLTLYLKFIEKSEILKRNKAYLNETIFYLIRFVVEKFYYPPQFTDKLTYAKDIIAFFKGQTSHFVSFCNYLTKRISLNEAKNEIVKHLLIEILSQNAKECIWVISFMKNFIIKGYNKQKNETALDKIQQVTIKQIFQDVETILMKTKKLNEQLKFIDKLVYLALYDGEQRQQKMAQFRSQIIPAETSFIFNHNYVINKIIDVKTLNNGKSAPVEVTFNLLHNIDKERHFKQQKIIIKANTNCPSKYRMQSNTANFFEETRIIDHDITYKIEHLSKYIIALEYVNNIGTLNQIVNKKYTKELKKVDQIYKTFFGTRKQSNQNENRLLEIFDEIVRKKGNTIPLSKILYEQSKNIKQWWMKMINFVRTEAQWSYLGYIVGLGDRHIDNILLTEELKLFHIDFQYCLDEGLKLPCPEYVPFRLTSCCLEPLGILGCYGLFYAKMIQSANEFDKKEPYIWRALSHFIGSMQTNVGQEIISRSKFTWMQVKNIEEGILQLINTAKQPQLLRMMFNGWRAFI